MLLNILNIILLDTEPGKLLYKSDKIYTVMTVVLIIWIGIIAYLILLNMKVTKMEKKLKDLNKNND